MERLFCVSFRFLRGAFHGRGPAGQPEWPPSPLRAFQALVESGARLNRGAVEGECALALQWLEAQAPPVILAPLAHRGSPYRISVPNNVMDVVARAWSRGNESNTGDASPATHRTMKTVRPLSLVDGERVSYLWAIREAGASERHLDILSGLARGVPALGWGIDTVVGEARSLSAAELASVEGERWEPGEPDEDGLRVPVPGTLAALTERHARFLTRITPDGFSPPPPLRAFRRVAYRRPGELQARPAAAFSLLTADASTFTSFDLVARGLTVAGMVRHAVRRAAEAAGWDETAVAAVVLGHRSGTDAAGEVLKRRFMYLPLPSIQPAGKGGALSAGRIRRVIVAGCGAIRDDDVRWLRKVLPGSELISEQSGQAVGVLSLVPRNDTVALRYLARASTWATVTPVVLPGYDDPAHYRRRLEKGVSAEEQRELLARLNDRIEGLLRKAIVQAGYAPEVARCVRLQWRASGWWPGADLASRYGVPHHLKAFPRLHVLVQWQDAHGKPLLVPGPVCFGGGRFYGIGLFAAVR